MQTISGPTVQNISEQHTKRITSTQQRHFGESKVNRCGEKHTGIFQWDRNVTKLDSDVGIFCCPNFILTPVMVNSFCSISCCCCHCLTLHLVDTRRVLPSLSYHGVSCTARLKCTGHMLCSSYPKIVCSLLVLKKTKEEKFKWRSVSLQKLCAPLPNPLFWAKGQSTITVAWLAEVTVTLWRSVP